MDGDKNVTSVRLPLMTSQQVAKFLQVSERTLWELTEPRGPIPAVRIGRSVRYVPEAIEMWLSTQGKPSHEA